MKKMIYEAPAVELATVIVELGFAASDSESDFNPGYDSEDIA